ncbi:MAG: hypothetical protein FWE19_08245 [Oscillospiraceae bacterium]|nr:hypothetical protein [Oscillospiraceae bacterium]
MSRAKLSLLNAKQELEVLRRSPTLLPVLLRCGLGVEAALALAGNACVVWAALGDERPASPEGVLERYSLSEIAVLCEELESRSKTEEVAQ